MSEQLEIMIKQNGEKLEHVEKDTKKIESRLDTCDKQLQKLYELYFPDGNYEEYMETN